MRYIYLATILLLFHIYALDSFSEGAAVIADKWQLPLGKKNRSIPSRFKLTPNGAFMAHRDRHLHTGVDFVSHGPEEPVFPAAAGEVVSIYAREPNKAIMVKHVLPDNKMIWTTYIHVTKITVKKGDFVTPETVIAQLMDRTQLNQYGWIYNHLHFEVLKTPRISEGGKMLSYSTRCRTKAEVEKYFYNPIKFFKKMHASLKK